MISPAQLALPLAATGRWGTGGTRLSRYFVKLLGFKQKDSKRQEESFTS
jgi:hypothetical protein